MPQGVKYVSPQPITDTTLPLLPPDQVAPFSANLASGVLGIWEMSRSDITIPSGAASGLVLPNAAFAQAKALIGGSPSASDLGLTFTTDASFVSGTTGLFERTAKGGFHGIVSQVNNTAANQNGAMMMAVTAAVSVMSWIIANPSHNYYYSLWDSITRVAAASPQGNIAGIQSNASPATNRLVMISEGTTVIYGGAGGNAQSGVANTTGQQYYQAAGAYGGTPPTLAAALGGIYWGTTSKGSTNSTTFNKHPSHIFYRMYLEDLTVSGRTFAQVAAVDTAAFNTAFASGGRYNGDTFTAPSTLP